MSTYFPNLNTIPLPEPSALNETRDGGAFLQAALADMYTATTPSFLGFIGRRLLYWYAVGVLRAQGPVLNDLLAEIAPTFRGAATGVWNVETWDRLPSEEPRANALTTYGVTPDPIATMQYTPVATPSEATATGLMVPRHWTNRFQLATPGSKPFLLGGQRLSAGAAREIQLQLPSAALYTLVDCSFVIRSAETNAVLFRANSPPMHPGGPARGWMAPDALRGVPEARVEGRTLFIQPIAGRVYIAYYGVQYRGCSGVGLLVQDMYTSGRGEVARAVRLNYTTFPMPNRDQRFHLDRYADWQLEAVVPGGHTRSTEVPLGHTIGALVKAMDREGADLRLPLPWYLAMLRAYDLHVRQRPTEQRLLRADDPTLPWWLQRRLQAAAVRTVWEEGYGLSLLALVRELLPRTAVVAAGQRATLLAASATETVGDFTWHIGFYNSSKQYPLLEPGAAFFNGLLAGSTERRLVLTAQPRVPEAPRVPAGDVPTTSYDSDDMDDADDGDEDAMDLEEREEAAAPAPAPAPTERLYRVPLLDHKPNADWRVKRVELAAHNAPGWEEKRSRTLWQVVPQRGDRRLAVNRVPGGQGAVELLALLTAGSGGVRLRYELALAAAPHFRCHIECRYEHAEVSVAVVFNNVATLPILPHTLRAQLAAEQHVFEQAVEVFDPQDTLVRAGLTDDQVVAAAVSLSRASE